MDSEQTKPTNVGSNDRLGLVTEQSAFEQWWFNEATVDALARVSSVHDECRIAWYAAVECERAKKVELAKELSHLLAAHQKLERLARAALPENWADDYETAALATFLGVEA